MASCLIVDDSPTIRKITRRIMEEFKFQCTEAEDGKDACDACENNMPDIIILDWNMPIMSGIDFLLHLRAMDGGDRPKVVFCTTENGMDFIQNGMAAGADEYIMKPFDKTILESKLCQLGLIQEPSA